MMGWLSFLKALLAAASAVANLIRDRSLLQAGENAAIARSLAEISDRLKIHRELVDQIEAMTDDEIDQALRGDR